MRMLSSILFVLMSMASIAHAQDYVRFRLPEGRRVTVGAETYQAFNLGEYVELLHIDNDLRFLTETHEQDIRRIENLTTAVTELQAVQTSSEESIRVLEQERMRLTTLWQEENRLRRNAENSHEFDWLPWTIAGGFAIATLVLVLVLIAGG